MSGGGRRAKAALAALVASGLAAASTLAAAGQSLPTPPAVPPAAATGPSAGAPPSALGADKAALLPAGPTPGGGGAGTPQGGGGSFGLPSDKNNLPVAVEADQGIEWQQQKQLYVARGNAKATRGDVAVYGQVLMAYYRKTAAGGSDIWRLEADGEVKIASPNETALGDKAVYDVDNGIFVLTGKSLKLDTPKAAITARDSLEYWQKMSYAVARGNAQATREDKSVRAKVLTAHFMPDQKGDLQIKNIEAFQDVLITTPNAVARAMYGDYNLESGIATLKGSVKITRGDDQLNGECAEVNLNTGISRLFACAKQDRVRGLLVPKQGQLPEDVIPRGRPSPGGPSGKPKP
jgi:lipopolysaccharide export system protein LptA